MQQQQQQQQLQQQQQISSVHPHYQPTPPPKPNQQQYEQQNIYHQQQLQQQLQQQQLPPTGLPSNALQQPLYHQQQIQNHYSIHPTARSPPNTIAMPTSQAAHMHPQVQQNIYTSGAANMMSGAATLRRPPPSNQVRDSIEAIPNSNLIDSAMFERDKQIYKCSTMRQGGKYDPRNFGPRNAMPTITNPNGGLHGTQAITKPSILNCPLPEIPKEYANSSHGDPNITSPRMFNGNNSSFGVQPAMTR